MPKRDGLEFEIKIAKPWAEKAFGRKFAKDALTLHIRGNEIKREVDLVSHDKSVLIACKSYKWRPGGKRPNGKFDDAKTRRSGLGAVNCAAEDSDVR